MNKTSNAREVGGEDHIERWQISRVDDIGAHPLEDLPHPPVSPKVFSGMFAQFEDVDAAWPNAIAEIGGFCGTNYCVAIAIFRQVIDQIDEPVLQTADRQSVDDMADNRLRKRHGLVACSIVAGDIGW